MFRTSLIFIGLLIIFTGCSGLGPSPQVPPYSIGIDISLKELKNSLPEYQVYYSDPSPHPSAVLFVPKKSDYHLKLLPGWQEAKDPQKLEDLIYRIDYSVPEPELYALLTPPKQKTGQRDLLGFIYTPGYSTLRPTDEENTFTLSPVSSQLNSIHHQFGDGESFGDF